MKRNYIIPVFITSQGCPHECVFCDQARITGDEGAVPGDTAAIIEKHLSTIPRKDARIEIGFFGGTFTGIPEKTQKDLLEIAEAFLKENRVDGIRLSTRPDYIDKGKLELLRHYGVGCIELGVQSMSDRVLAKIRRGYTSKDVENASRMILEGGFELGHQMMVGLPDSGLTEELYTAEKAKELGASQVRIYPLVVIKGTELADWFEKGEYMPLSEDEAVRRCVNLTLFFQASGIKILRCGLHPSEGLLSGDGYIAGPFHTAFRQKVESRIFALIFRIFLEKQDVSGIDFNPEDEASIHGFKKENMPLIEKLRASGGAALRKDASVQRGGLRVSTKSGGTFVFDRSEIAKELIGEENACRS